MRVLFSGEERGRARIVARENLILAGVPFASRVFQLLDSGTEVKILAAEGERLKPKQPVLEASGRLVSLFSAERVALNLLQHLSGIATLTRSYVRELRGLRTVLLDTRKTNPGLRVLEKYAVRIGGGGNHRFGLDDGILIKTNHIRAAGGVTEAVRRARQSAPHHLKIEVEVRNFRELEDAVLAEGHPRPCVTA
jgi:nicotinate-nucleotide pyrophosphorylase (carboxylating)